MGVKKTVAVSETDALIKAAIEGMEEKKAEKIVLADLRNIRSAPADYFLICHGESDRQTDAISRSVDEFVKKKTGEDAWHIEGGGNAEWILLDYINVVVHVFRKEKREFYGLEELWGDAVLTQIN